MSVRVAMPFSTRVSSAKHDRQAFATSLSMSLIRTRKRLGSCGTPEITGLVVDFLPLMTTVWVLFV